MEQTSPESSDTLMTRSQFVWEQLKQEILLVRKEGTSKPMSLA